ncbi:MULTISPECIES: HD domain-containing protein [Acidaminococcus]|jgi:hypothetical protein|uniref:HD domain-containing protein n=1 Tax=Acidaminococcus TaxID=904 RepID=UPI0023F55A9C|nr:HD domain-containing protein [Acidaminococcus massiliensis]
MEPLEKIAQAAIAYDKGDPKRIHHLLKVHAFARIIGLGEGLDPRTLFRLEAAAYLHDIGIHEGERRFGRNDGKIQEELGPDVARPMLEEAGITGEDAGRILWLIGHHHTYTSIDGPDAQILAEADMLVNPYEDGTSRQQNEALYQRLYKTESGKQLFEELYLKEWSPVRQGC